MVVLPGFTGKFTPLVLVPMFEPALATVYHLMVLPAEVAFSCEVPPGGQSVAGDAVTEVGAEGTALMVIAGET